MFRSLRVPAKLGFLGLIGLFAITLSLALVAGGCDEGGGGGEIVHHKPPPPPPNACLPSSSLSILVKGKDATVYAPNSDWEGDGTTGVTVVPIETSAGIGTGGAPTMITTPNDVNSCSSNSSTGETVCVANNTDVYLISGSTLNNTLTSGATSTQSFSGGRCTNCGVVVDSTTNKALITLGLATGGPGGYQFLDLSGNTLETAIPAGGDTSEDVSVDPTRHLILSPNEAGNYQILNTSGATPAIFNNVVSGSPEFDSAAEDCSTGIALSTIEFTANLYIADLTQAVFTPGTPGTWTDTGAQVQNFPDFDILVTDNAGTNGIAIAPGTHLGVVTGEFGDNHEGVIQLPSTSGSGVPAATDWVVFTMPNLATGAPWSQGFDPHTVTAYVSPNTGKALAVLANGDAITGPSAFTFLAVVDLQGLLSAPRTGHVVNNPLPAGLVTYIAR